MRNVDTSSAEFQFFARRAQRILAEEAIAELPSEKQDIETPCGPFSGVKLSAHINNICAISIIRSGDALVESVRECLPGVTVGKILIQRNEESKEKEAKYFYSKMPPNIKDMDIILCDPMLATGGSAKAAIEVLVKDYKVDTKRIVFANMITCPEGLKAMEEAYPEVKIVTACVDDCLNEEKYIIPGLGDYGDRFFNTV
jgi:uracil phosphoribosyltransferase